MVKLILVRHGESEYNTKRCFTGHSNIALTSLGVRQAELTARYLKDHFRVDAIYSSDLQRAYNTAVPFATAADLPIHCDSALRETNVGDWQDRLYDDIVVEYPREIEAYHDRKLDFRFPNGENSADVYARASHALEQIAKRHDGETVAVFSHGGVIRTLCRKWMGLKPEQFHQAPLITNASITLASYNEGCAALLQISYDQHLKELDSLKEIGVV